MRVVPWVPVGVLALVILVAIFAPVLSPHSPIQGDLAVRLRPPFWAEGGDPRYLLGTDELGRDVLSRVIFGARISLSVSVIGVLASTIIGTSLGLLAGYFGGTVDAVIMRLADMALSIPLILVALLLAVVVGTSYINVFLIVILLLWPRLARQIRGEAVAISKQDFIALARVGGVSHLGIIRHHVLPNIFSTLLVLVTLALGDVIILEAFLSFLGVGIPSPQPSWGTIIADGRLLISTAWWLSIFPGLLIAVTVLSTNMLGDWARDRWDPKLRPL